MKITLPCDLNDRIYHIVDTHIPDRANVQEERVVEISRKYNRSGVDLGWGIITDYGTRYSLKNLDKTWWLDKKAADKVLKEFKNKHEG